MNNRLKKLYAELEKEKHRTLSLISHSDTSRNNTAPGEGRWSVNQILAHLVRLESIVASEVKSRINEGRDLGPRTLKSDLSSFILNIALLSPFRFKAPGVVRYPPEDPDYGQLVEEWSVIRSSIHTILEEFPPVN